MSQEELAKLWFFVGPAEAQPQPGSTCFHLVPDKWDDYSAQTQFSMQLHAPSSASPIVIGDVKVLAREYPPNDEEKRRTRDLLQPTFYALDPSRYCSLGQSSSFYRELGQLAKYGLPAGAGQHVVKALGDVCFRSDPKPWWESDSDFVGSLLRFPAAHIARREARILIAGQTPEQHVQNAIPTSELPGWRIEPRGVQFEFDGGLDVPGRINVLVGKNGSGKTSTLEKIASWLASDAPRASGSKNYRPQFSRVVFVSSNAFDSTSLSRKRDLGSLRFVGYEPGDSTKLAELIAAARAAKTDEGWVVVRDTLLPNAGSLLAAVPKRSEGLPLILNDLRGIQGWQSFALSMLDDEALGALVIKEPARAIDEMSAGQRALTTLYAGLFKHLDHQGLVLLDEPENYLHPSLIARFVRHLNDLLADRRAFALVATHSPILVQETVRRFVWIVTRRDDDVTLVENPNFETFGESIENIDEYLFDTDFKSSHWKRVLRGFAEALLPDDEIARRIGSEELPLLARGYLERERIKVSRGS